MPDDKPRRRPRTTDERLRDHGFRIHSRPRGGEPIWQRNGRRYLQTVALRLIDAELRELER